MASDGSIVEDGITFVQESKQRLITIALASAGRNAYDTDGDYNTKPNREMILKKNRKEMRTSSRSHNHYDTNNYYYYC